MSTRYWPKRMAMSVIAIGSALFVGCTDKPGSAGWCEQMSGKTKSEWAGEDAKTFASHCVFESTTIGSESWCENLNEMWSYESGGHHIHSDTHYKYKHETSQNY